MNIQGINQGLLFIGGVIELLDSSILTIIDIAHDTGNKELEKSADLVEMALERLVTRELELERVLEVLNDFEMDASQESEAL